MDSRDNETTPRQHKNDIPCHLSLHNKNAMINEVSQLCNPTAGSSVTVPFRSLSSTKNDAAMHHSQTQRLKLKSLLLGIFQQECGRKLACTGEILGNHTFDGQIATRATRRLSSWISKAACWRLPKFKCRTSSELFMSGKAVISNWDDQGFPCFCICNYCGEQNPHNNSTVRHLGCQACWFGLSHKEREFVLV